MRVLVCGGRDYDDVQAVHRELNNLSKKHGRPLTIIQGGAPGADKLARDWALLQLNVTFIHVPADWETYGRAAGPIRNNQMLEEKPDLVLAFPGGKGTASMIQLAEAAGVPVIRIK